MARKSHNGTALCYDYRPDRSMVVLCGTDRRLCRNDDFLYGHVLETELEQHQGQDEMIICYIHRKGES